MERKEQSDKYYPLASDPVGPGTRGDHDLDNSVKDNKGEIKVTLVQKLMLSSQLLGNEACMTYEQLYAIPILQTLGMPMSLVSLTGFISGLSSILLLPFLGWLVDRGSNQFKRKVGTIFLAAGCTSLSMTFIIVANILHLNFLSEYNSTQTNGSANDTIKLFSIAAENDGFFISPSGNNLSSVDNFTHTQTPAWENDSSLWKDSDATTRAYPSVEPVAVNSNSILNVPVKAILGFISIVFLEIGFDLVNGMSKTFALSCCPRREQTSLLVVGLMMASAGGLSTTVFGVVDFPAVLGIDFPKGGELNIQTTVQAVIIFIFVSLSLLLTLVSGHNLVKRAAIDNQLNTIVDVAADVESTSRNIPGQRRTSNSKLDIFESSMRSIGGAGAHFGMSLALLQAGEQEQKQLERESSVNPDDELTSLIAVDTHEESTFHARSKQTPPAVRVSSATTTAYIEEVALSDRALMAAVTDVDGGKLQRVCYSRKGSKDNVLNAQVSNYNSLTHSVSNVNEPLQPDLLHSISLSMASRQECSLSMSRRPLHDVPQHSTCKLDEAQSEHSFEELLTASGPRCYEACSPCDKVYTSDQSSCTTMRMKIALLCVSVVFGIGQVVMFSMMTSDFVGKEVYGGLPEAEPGSESLARYHEGMRMASWGWLVCYATYLALCFGNSKLLALLGYRLEFAMASLLMATASVVLAVTARLEAFFILTVCAGFHRACLFVIPFVVTNDIVQATASSNSGPGVQKNVALPITLVTASIPMGYMSLFTWVGPLESATGIVSIPLWLGAIFGLLSILAFSCVKPKYSKPN